MYEKRFELVKATSDSATLHDKETNETKTWHVERDPKKGSYAIVLENNRKARVYLYKLTADYQHRNETIAEEYARMSNEAKEQA